MAIDPKKLSLKENGPAPGRLQSLDPASVLRKVPGKRYTSTVRFLRLALPLMAVAIVGLLMVWPRMEQGFEPLPRESVVGKNVEKNEVINPRFESKDDKRQPFIITASRALQSADDPDVILLDKPMADMTLTDSTWLAGEALNGAYRQQDERLLLQGKVKLFHDKGYQLETEKLMVDLKNQEAWTEVDVYGQGPAGTIEADGLRAYNEKGVLIFTGPVRLVLNRKIEGL